MDKVIKILEQNINNLHGDWITKPSKYEADFCKLLGWECVDSRYYDAVMDGNILIEIKKCQKNMFFNLARYGEIVHGIGPKGTITITILYKAYANKGRKQQRKIQPEVLEIIVMDTEKMISYMSPENLNEWAYAIKLSKNAHRRVCIQEEFDLCDMEDMAECVIKTTKYQQDLTQRNCKGKFKHNRRIQPTKKRKRYNGTLPSVGGEFII